MIDTMSRAENTRVVAERLEVAILPPPFDELGALPCTSIRSLPAIEVSRLPDCYFAARFILGYDAQKSEPRHSRSRSYRTRHKQCYKTSVATPPVDVRSFSALNTILSILFSTIAAGAVTVTLSRVVELFVKKTDPRSTPVHLVIVI